MAGEQKGRVTVNTVVGLGFDCFGVVYVPEKWPPHPCCLSDPHASFVSKHDGLICSPSLM